MNEIEDDGNVKKIINCSFCNKGRQQVEQMIEGPEFNGEILYICNECVDVTHEILHAEAPEKSIKKRKEKIPCTTRAHTAYQRKIKPGSEKEKAGAWDTVHDPVSGNAQAG